MFIFIPIGFHDLIAAKSVSSHSAAAPEAVAPGAHRNLPQVVRTRASEMVKPSPVRAGKRHWVDLVTGLEWKWYHFIVTFLFRYLKRIFSDDFADYCSVGILTLKNIYTLQGCRKYSSHQ